VEEGGFEPPKRNATDLQSAPFGHSGTPPYAVVERTPPAAAGAGGRIRTPDLLITNQLLYRLSYTSKWRLSNSKRNYSKERERCQVKKEKNFKFSEKIFSLSGRADFPVHKVKKRRSIR
jgi:hypothetical protein